MFSHWKQMGAYCVQSVLIGRASAFIEAWSSETSKHWLTLITGHARRSSLCRQVKARVDADMQLIACKSSYSSDSDP